MDPRERDKRKFKQRHTQALLDKAYDEIVSSQLERLKSKKSYTENDEDAYRLELEADRDRAAKKRRKVMSAEHEELARTTGLSVPSWRRGITIIRIVMMQAENATTKESR